MEKVYIVIVDSGSWDSWGIRINKIFKNKEDAEKYANELTIEYNHKKSLIPIDKTMDENFEGDFDEEYEKYNKEYSEFRKQYPNYDDFYEFNKCIIEEFDLN